MKSLGFYRQLRHGYPQGPDLTAAADGSLPSRARTEVARYLRDCPVVAATTQRADDVLDPRQTNVSGINIHTDGTYVWPEDLAYYVERYGVAVPDDLAERAHRDEIPELDQEEMGRIEDWLIAGADRPDRR